ncbi:hypothetical protein C1646_757924 [Rhizophagus diaphanus]|nr:hypothetical protein C1646_757924 [Rhizophagus diaphanus] [Rhizophagus sp. MUCL 43196]
MTEFKNNICQALRPRFNGIKVPQLTYDESYDELERIDINNKTELQKQIKESEKINNSLPITSSKLFTNLSYKTHTEAIFTRGLFNSNNLS